MQVSSCSHALLRRALDLLSAIRITEPHGTGNHDLGLDRNHKKFLPQSLELFTSAAAKSAGIQYIDRAIQPCATISSRTKRGQLRVYGNPLQPDFLNTSYAFTYAPDPSDQAAAAWAEAPTHPDAAPVWVTHGPPQGRLDWIPLPPLRGCAEQARCVARARPVLAVFGHYHISHGVELVSWREGREGAEEEGAGRGDATPAMLDGVEVLVRDGKPCHLDFTKSENIFRRGEKTIFVNAAWMTLEKRKVEERYQPIVIDLPVSLLL